MTDHSRVGYTPEEQVAVHDELKEFLGSDDDTGDDEDDEDYVEDEEEDDEGNASEKEPAAPAAAGKSRKRKREKNETGDEVSVASEESGSRLAQRLKRSEDDDNKSKESQAAADRSANVTRDQDPGSFDDNEVDYAENVDYDEDELEREMLAAFETGEFDENAEETIGADNG